MKKHNFYLPIIILLAFILGTILTPRVNAAVHYGDRIVEIYLTDEEGNPIEGAEFELITPDISSTTTSNLFANIDASCLTNVMLLNMDCASEIETAYTKLYSRAYNLINPVANINEESTLGSFNVAMAGTTDAEGKFTIQLDPTPLLFGDIRLYGIKQISTAEGYQKSDKIRYFRILSDLFDDFGYDILIANPAALKLPSVATLDDYDLNQLKSNPNIIFTDVMDYSGSQLHTKWDEEAFEKVEMGTSTYQYYLINYKENTPNLGVPNTGTSTSDASSVGNSFRFGGSIISGIIVLIFGMIGLIVRKILYKY